MSDEVIGRAKGGKARAEALSAKERKEIAKKGAEARWGSATAIKATHGDPDRPLRIGNLELPCYVLEDGTRVLSQRGMIGSLGIARGGDRLVTLLGSKSISPFISNELMAAIENPIKFSPPGGGGPAFGYPATILADICEAILAARAAGGLQAQQSHIADQCEILVRGFARVGIIALVDEATGYEKDRIKGDLSRILEAFIAKELQPWVKTFPAEYYEYMFKLRGLPYSVESMTKRPQYFGHLTNNIVYKRLAPGVLDEIKRGAKKDREEGKPTSRLHQRLTPDLGHPKLQNHLTSVVTIMKLSDNWRDFEKKLDKLHPQYGVNLEFPLDDE